MDNAGNADSATCNLCGRVLVFMMGRAWCPREMFVGMHFQALPAAQLAERRKRERLWRERFNGA